MNTDKRIEHTGQKYKGNPLYTSSGRGGEASEPSNPPLSYPLYLLKNALRDEIIAKTDAVNYSLGEHAYDHKIVGADATRKAFEESGNIADERIPQLQNAAKACNHFYEMREALEEAKSTASAVGNNYDIQRLLELSNKIESILKKTE